MHKEVVETIEELNDEIKEKQSQIALIECIDWDKAINEKTWHSLCKTSLRRSPLLGVMVKNIFPNAYDIEVGCNYVYFHLCGIKCAIHTSNVNGVCVDVDWYRKPKQPPIDVYGGHNYMKMYFDAKDNGANWLELFNLKYGATHNMKHYRKWVKAILWLFHYKWVDDERNRWEEIFAKDEQKYQETLKKIEMENALMHKKVLKMANEVIPTLKEFSSNVHILNSSLFHPSLEEIFEIEGIST